MSTARPGDSVTMSLSDSDMCALVAKALDDNVIYTGGYNQDVSISVESIEWNEGWDIKFTIDVEEKE